MSVYHAGVEGTNPHPETVAAAARMKAEREGVPPAIPEFSDSPSDPRPTQSGRGRAKKAEEERSALAGDRRAYEAWLRARFNARERGDGRFR